MTTVMLTEASDPLVGRVIDGKYRILELLGEGGMARVYTALHLTLDHLVAIKLLRKELANDPDIAERFAREGRTIAQLNSEHIVKMLDVGHLDGAGPFMVMEHLEGEDLQTRLRRTGPLSLVEATKYVTQAALGLHQAHEQGIVHRDLKPENLFLARTGREVETLKLLDFGISKQTRAQVSRLTKPQMALGSPAYMAPEQLMGSDHIDARADVWSLGVVLYQLVTGVLPFTGLSVAEVYVNILHSEPLAPSHFRPDLPRGFDDLVLRCLAKPALERPSSVGAVALELKDVVSGRSHSRTIASNVSGDHLGSVAPVSVTTRLSIGYFGAARRWRAVTAIAGLLLGSLGTLALAANSFSIRAEPIPTLAGGGADITSIDGLRAQPPAVVDIADLPLELATDPAHPEPKPAPTRLRKPPALPRSASLSEDSKPLRGDIGRLPARTRPERSTDFPLSDFGGRR